MDADELVILGEKLGLSGDALWAWLEEENAKEREALREELALAREVAALEERNRQLRMRLLEAENAARARASVRVDSVSFIGPGTWRLDELDEAKDSFGSQKWASSLNGGLNRSASGRRSISYEEASMPMEKSSDTHKELKNEAKANHKPERSIASYDTMERSGSFESDAPMQTDAEECTRIKHGHILIASSRERAINVWRESHFRKCKKSSMGSSESTSRAGMNETSGMATEEGHMPTAGEDHSDPSAESRATALVLLGMNEKVSTNNEPGKEQVFASLGDVSHAGETKCEAAEREWGRDLSKRTPERDEKNEQSHMSTAHVRVSLRDEKSLSSVTLCTAERIPFYMVQLLACRPRPSVSVPGWLGPKLRNLNVWWRYISSWHNSFHIKHSNLTGKSKLCDCVEFQNAFLRSYGHVHVLSLRCKHVIDDNRLVWDAIT